MPPKRILKKTAPKSNPNVAKVAKKRMRDHTTISDLSRSSLPPDAGDDLPTNSLHRVQPIPDDLSMAVTLGISNLDTLPSIMQDFGFVIVTNVMSVENVTRVLKLFDEDLRSSIAISDAQIKTHPIIGNSSLSLAKSWPTSTSPPASMVQGKCAWAVRMDDNVSSVFKKIYSATTTTTTTTTTTSSGSEKAEDIELCVGEMEDVLFSNEQESAAAMGDDFGMVDNSRWVWPQRDGGVTHLHPTSYSGELFVWPATYGSSTTVVWPLSHIQANNNTDETNNRSSLEFSDDFSEVSQFDAGAVRLVVPSGALVLYDSRLLRQRWMLGPQLSIPVQLEPRDSRSIDVGVQTEACLNGLSSSSSSTAVAVKPFSSCLTAEVSSESAFPVSSNTHQWLVDQATGKLHPRISRCL